MNELHGRGTERASARMLALLASLLPAACSVLPPHGFPQSEEREVMASYDFDGGPIHPVVVPASRPGLVVLSLTADPPWVDEDFVDGRRALTPAGRHMVIRCRYRIERRPDGSAPTPAELFPGADEVRVLDRSTDRGPHHLDGEFGKD